GVTESHFAPGKPEPFAHINHRNDSPFNVDDAKDDGRSLGQRSHEHGPQSPVDGRQMQGIALPFDTENNQANSFVAGLVQVSHRFTIPRLNSYSVIRAVPGTVPLFSPAWEQFIQPISRGGLLLLRCR